MKLARHGAACGCQLKIRESVCGYGVCKCLQRVNVGS